MWNRIKGCLNVILNGSDRPSGLLIREPEPEQGNPDKEFLMFSRSKKPETLFQRLGHRATGNKGLRSNETCKL